MELKDYIYFGENGEITYTHSMPLYFNKYHYKNYFGGSSAIKIVNVNSIGAHISTLWKMQAIGEMHGVNILEYDNSGYTDLDIERGNFTSDTLDEYFEELAHLAAWYGCEAMELKCLTKALFWKYELAESADSLPQRELQSLYVRLSHAGYKKCGEWLLQYHCKKLRVLFDKLNDDGEVVDNSNYARNIYDYRTNYNVISDDLAEYLNKHILPRYAAYDKGHQAEHILQVVNRCKELVEENDLNSAVNIDLLLTAAYFLDLGLLEGKEMHYLTSAKMLRHDKFIKEYYTSEQINIIAEAIEDQRISLQTIPRTLYGELLSAATKVIDEKEIIKQAYCNSESNNPHFTQEEHIEAVYQQLLAKYGKNGCVKRPKYITKDNRYQLLELEYQLLEMSQFTEYCTQHLALK